jgi:thioredoxin reductase (NADPH)
MSAKLFGTTGSPEAFQIRDFLQRSNYPFTWVELRTDGEAQKHLGLDLHDTRLPICILPGGTTLYRPSIQEVARALDWFKSPKYSLYDLAIYGAGPAGLSAAVYGASEGLRTILIEKSAVGGQAGSTSRIENYLGFPDGISGWELASKARQQAMRLGAEIIITAEAVGGGEEDGNPVGFLASGDKVVSRVGICATGVEYRRLTLPNEDRFLDRGLFYGAGSSEASLCAGDVFVIGGGNSAGQAALNLARYAGMVTLLVRGSSLKSTLSSYLIERIERSPKIRVLTDCTLASLDGEIALERISYRNSRTNETVSVATSWVFICIGGEPRTDWDSKGLLQLDSAGYILTGPDIDLSPDTKAPWKLSRAPLFLETSLHRIFAAGDIRHGSIKRCATAVGEGATAVSMVHRYLATF